MVIAAIARPPTRAGGGLAEGPSRPGRNRVEALPRFGRQSRHQERIASRLERVEASCGRRMLRGTGVLATIGATAPGLFRTSMNSFIGISKACTPPIPPWPRRVSPSCSRPLSGSPPRFRPWSSTTCSRARLRLSRWARRCRGRGGFSFIQPSASAHPPTRP